MLNQTDPFSIALFLAGLSLLPVLLITATSFLKTSIVLLIVRNAIGVQQVPPGIAMYSIALMMTLYVMAPTFQEMIDAVPAEAMTAAATPRYPLLPTVQKGVEPLRKFMLNHAKADQRELFLEKAKKLWPEKMSRSATSKDFLVVMPAFMISEMQAGFEMGFLIYIPFLVIDVLVSNVLMALGMQMMSPTTVSVPLKLFLFVIVDGWGKLLHSVLDSYL
jgi:type III secretion protein R